MYSYKYTDSLILKIFILDSRVFGIIFSIILENLVALGEFKLQLYFNASSIAVDSRVFGIIFRIILENSVALGEFKLQLYFNASSIAVRALAYCTEYRRFETHFKPRVERSLVILFNIDHFLINSSFLYKIMYISN